MRVTTVSCFVIALSLSACGGSGSGQTSPFSTQNGSGSGEGSGSANSSGGGSGASGAGGSGSSTGSGSSGSGSTGRNGSSGSSSGSRGTGDAGTVRGDSGTPQSDAAVVVRGGSEPSKLPTVNGTCPTITNGTVTISNVPVVLQVGATSSTQKGPIFIYWHGTGGSAADVAFGINPDMTQEILSQGGVIASPNGTTGTGLMVDWGVWNGDDMAVIDQVVACAIQQLNIDTRRIYVGGASAGGLMAGAMAYQRSGYVAAVTPNSGGIAPYPGLNTLQDPAHVPAVLTMHGAMGTDMVVLDFAQVSLAMDQDLASKGGFAVDCDHGGGHTAAPMDLKSAAWVFMKDHPYGVSPEPYAGGLPSGYPAYCKIIK